MPPMPEEEIDTSAPSPARMHDYALGGTANYAVDRRAAEAMFAAWPGVRPLARDSRAFLERVVSHLAGRGIGQFIDLGAGLPVQDNAHQVARRENPDARVVYVDHDPVVLAHGRALAHDDATAYVDADVRDTDAVLKGARGILDLDRPVALLALAVLHYVPGDPAGVMERYISALPPGSYVAVSHVTRDGVDPELVRAAAAVHGGGQYLRTAAEIEAMFGGLPLIEPGLVDVQRWRHTGEPGPLRILGGAAVRR